MAGEAELKFIETDSTIVTSTIFKLSVPGEYSERYHYSRFSNPTRDSLERALASLDKADYTVTFSSKVAGSLALISSLKLNDRVIFSDSLNCQKFRDLSVNIDTEFVNFDDLENLEISLKANTKIVWIESLAIPLMKQHDIETIAKIVHKKSALLVVDNTFLTSHFLLPLEAGADIVVYSINEFISGHDDISMGAVTTNSAVIHEKLKYYQYSSGAVPSPFECFMVKRGLKTLSLRMERHSENSMAVARFLSNHSKVEKVFPSTIKMNTMKNSGVLSFKLKLSKEAVKKFLVSLKSVSVSEFLGGCDSKATFPWAMSHSHLQEEERITAGVTHNLIILSIGIEDSREIIGDIDQALANV